MKKKKSGKKTSKKWWNMEKIWKKHNRGPPKHHGTQLGNKKGLIMHLIIWKTVHFKVLTWIWLSKVKDQIYPKKAGERDLFFSFPKVVVHNRVPSKQLSKEV